MTKNDLTIDLHVHSTASDGTFMPAEVVRYAHSHGISVMALTDHDSMGGVAEALEEAARISACCGCEGGRSGITVIPGIEISTERVGLKDVHILGYFPDPSAPALAELLKGAKQRRYKRNAAMAELITAAGYPVTVEELSEGGRKVVTRAEFARFLVEAHACRDIGEAFDKYVGDGKRFYIKSESVGRREAVEALLAAGGIPVLAHPLRYGISGNELEELVRELAGYGIMGLEGYYSTNMGRDEDTVRHLALKYGLIMTGGSDFHGSNKPDIQIGTGTGGLKVPYSAYEELLRLKDMIK